MGREDLGPSISGGRGNERGDLATKPILTPSHLDPAIHEGAIEGEGEGSGHAFGVGILPSGEICGGRDTGGDAWRACGMSDLGRKTRRGGGSLSWGRELGARVGGAGSRAGYLAARLVRGRARGADACGMRKEDAWGGGGHGDAVDALAPPLRCSRDIYIQSKFKEKILKQI
jgi:hypothetical protein